MAISDAFSEAEESVVRYSVTQGAEKIVVYELKLSNAEEVLRQCLDFIHKDSAGQKRFILIFNAKHVKANTVGIIKLKTILKDYSELLFSARLHKFAIMIKSFTLHRNVVGMFDEIFDQAGFGREKYNYFSMKDKDEVLQWLVAKK